MHLGSAEPDTRPYRVKHSIDTLDDDVGLQGLEDEFICSN